MKLVILVTLATAVTAMPSYIAVPADQIAFVDLTALRVRRVPRQTLAPPPALPQALYSEDYQPIPLQRYQQQPVDLNPPPVQQEQPVRLVRIQQPDPAGEASARLAERPPDFGEYVDFGAHTGDQGAFGWYADYPVNNQGDSGYRK